MRLPFTIDEFLALFGRYNRAVWPTQIALYALAFVVVALAVRPTPRSGRWIALLVGVLWSWMGIVYHWIFFTRINPAAWAFGALFVAEGAALVVVGVRQRPEFALRLSARGIVGLLLAGYAMVAYPVLAASSGHGYPDGPTFGLPCPTVVFTFAVLLWAAARVPRWLLVVPALWSLVGGSAAWQLGMVEDFGLLVAGIVGTALVLTRRATPSPVLAR